MRVGVVLAAGASRRMGRRKALMSTAGASFLAHAVRRLWVACDVVVVVLGAGAREVRAGLEGELERLVAAGRLRADAPRARRSPARALELRFVTHRAWASGMLGSARAGLRAARKLGPGPVLLTPVDHPHVRPDTVRVLAAAMDAALAAYRGPARARERFAYAVVPRHRRRRGHPVAMSPGLVAALLRDAGGSDLSDAIRRNARLIGYLDVHDAGVVRNRNTPAD